MEHAQFLDLQQHKSTKSAKSKAQSAEERQRLNEIRRRVRNSLDSPMDDRVNEDPTASMTSPSVQNKAQKKVDLSKSK